MGHLQTIIAENFTETVFLFICLYLLYLSLRGYPEVQNYLLLSAGYLVYGFIKWQHLILLLVITTITYTVGNKLTGVKKGKQLLVGTIILFVAILVFFRYFSLLVNSLSLIFTPGNQMSLSQLIPLGISFYTLQAISYLVEVHSGRLVASHNPVHVALYLSFIFKLPAGPIERPSSFLLQIRNPRHVTVQNLNSGLFLIILGLFEKKVISDNLAPMVNQVFGDPAGNAGINILVATVGFAFQLYGDFSGYSNIARGLAKFFGYDLMINFKLPYFSTSPNEFWLRWHISLSTWLREYIFFPTRRWLVSHKYRGIIGVIVPIIAGMVVSGIWHGKTVNFVLWGLYFALLQIAYFYLDHFPYWRKTKATSVAIAIFRVGLMFILICAGWLIFRAESLDNLRALVSNISLQPNEQTYGYVTDIVFFVGPILGLNLVQAYTEDLLIVTKWPIILQAIAYAGLLVWILIFGAPVGAEFIYAGF